MCPTGCAILYRPLMEQERLVVVLDLDETLVQALTLGGYAERLERLNEDIAKQTEPDR